MIAQLQTVPDWRLSHLSGGKGAAGPDGVPDLPFIPSLRSWRFLVLTSSSPVVGKLNWSRETDVLLTEADEGTWRPIHWVCKETGHRKQSWSPRNGSKWAQPKSPLCPRQLTHMGPCSQVALFLAPVPSFTLPTAGSPVQLSAWVYTGMDKSCCFQQ